MAAICDLGTLCARKRVRDSQTAEPLYDWHSSVHGHWLLARLVRSFPDAPFVQAAREALRQSLTAENMAQEAAYLRGEGRASFERPYGLAWLLQLVAEFHEWDDPQGKEMAANLHPLEKVVF